LQPIPEVSELRSDASTTICAEWKVTTDDADAIALEGESLRSKLENAHVFGIRGPSYRPTAYSYPTNAESEFSLSFVGVLTDGQRKRATTVAMSNARQRAAELAQIAGMDLAETCSVASIISQSSVRGGPVVALSPCSTSIPVFDQSEVVSQSPDLPEITVHVTVSCPVLSKPLANR
jgi:hypothetical protein